MVEGHERGEISSDGLVLLRIDGCERGVVLSNG